MFETEKSKKVFLDVSFWILFVISLLLPLFFLPTKATLLFFDKTLLIYAGTIISLVFLLAHLLKGGSVFLPRWPLVVSSLFILITYFVSSLATNNFPFSYFGYGFEVGSLSFLVLFFTVLLLSSLIFQSEERLKLAYLIVAIPCIVLSLYYLVKIFTSSRFFSLESFFSLNTDTFLGGWNELAILAGGGTLFSLLFLAIAKATKKLKWLYFFVLFVSVLLLIVINFKLAWIISLSVFVIFVIVSFFKSREKKFDAQSHFFELQKVGNKYLLVTFFILSLIFIFPTGDLIKDKVYNHFIITFLEVKPSWSGTYDIFQKTLKENTPRFLLGSGPNSFSYVWRLYKPANVNLTSYWNTQLNYATGLIPTFFITGGILGLLAWLVFIVSYLSIGFKYIYKNFYDYLGTSTFLISLYFWIISFLYVPSQTLFIFTALFSGIFLAHLITQNNSVFPEISFLKSSTKTIIFTALVFTVLVLNSANGFVIYKKFVASLHFEKGVSAYYAGDLKNAEEEINKSLGSSESDISRGLLSDIYLSKLRQSYQEKKDPNEKDIAEFQDYFKLALLNLEKALQFNPRNFEMYIKLGTFQEFLAEIGVQGADEKARDAYTKAGSLDPFNPLPDLLLSSLHFSSGALEPAEKNIFDALSKKPDYGEALFLDSKIKFLQGQLPEAIQSAIETVAVFPNESYSHFYLGMLYYQAQNYKDALKAFKDALTLEPKFPNARYLLALSLAKNNQKDEAVKELEYLLNDYPNNEAVLSALKEIKGEEKPAENTKLPFNE